ncbi:hypothetical protein BDN70DRAFT_956371 [Pholiota conissans]|uniref:Uncharacterized protein n=1 Tax=Pholiota conissans TaxID=109636 RepID=A0A9P6CWR4_9AGAR|nr:hypothetical protein BDN70DRAFT_956371 [Pholiota conissans]
MAFHRNPLDLTVPIAASIFYNLAEYSLSASLITGCRTLPSRIFTRIQLRSIDTVFGIRIYDDSESHVQLHGGFTFIKELYCTAYPYINSRKGQGQGVGTNLAATSGANTVEGYGPNPQLQRAFLHFLVKNRRFLKSLPDSTTSSIAKVKQAFEQNSLTFDHSADLDIIIQQFKAEVATPANRRECDLKKKNTLSAGKFERWFAE